MIMFPIDAYLEQVDSFVQFGIENFEDKIKSSVVGYHTSTTKERNKLIDNVLVSWAKTDPEFADAFKMKQFKDTTLAKHSVLFALFMFHLK